MWFCLNEDLDISLCVAGEFAVSTPFFLWKTQVAVKLLFSDAFHISYLYRVLHLVKSFTPVEYSCKMQVAHIKHSRCALHREARQLWAV